MLIRKIHFEIEQLLQEQGIFNHRDFTHDEIDNAFNFVTNEFVTSLLSDNSKVTDGVFAEINQYYTDVTKTLKRRYIGVGTKQDNRYLLGLPADYFGLISDNSYVYKECRGYKTKVIKTDYHYKVIDKPVKYNGIWYKKDDVFKGITNNTNVYPNIEVFELKVKLSPNRLKRSEDIQWIIDDLVHTTSFKSPISELVNNDLIIYLNNFDIASVEVTYYKTPNIVSFENNVNPEFPDNVCYYLIRQSVVHLQSSISEKSINQK